MTTSCPNCKRIAPGGICRHCGSETVKVHNKTHTLHWTDDHSPETFEREFRPDDVIVSLDPQERLGEKTYVVSTIDDNGRDLTQRSLFWHEAHAFDYAHHLRDCSATAETKQSGEQ